METPEKLLCSGERTLATVLLTTLLAAGCAGPQPARIDARRASELVEGGTDLNKRDQQGNTVLNQAVSGRDVEAARQLIAGGANINRKNSSAEFPLWLAVKLRDAEMLQMLLTNGANPNLSGENGETALHLCIRGGRDSLAERLLTAGADPNLASILGDTPLTLAAARGSTNLVALLCQHGARVNDHAEDMDTPLITAAASGELQTLTFLISRGANLETRGVQGCTALMGAAMAGNADACRILIEAGARLDATNALGFDALAGAVFNQQLQTSRLLVHHGARYSGGTNGLEEQFCFGMYEKSLADELLSSGKTAEARLSFEAAKASLTWARKQFDTEAHAAAHSASVQTFWYRVLLTAAEGLAEGMLQVGSTYQGTANYRYQTQLVALRNAKTPEQYYANYHYLTSQSAGTAGSSSGRVAAVEGGTPYKASILRARAIMMDASMNLADKLIQEIDSRLAGTE